MQANNGAKRQSAFTVLRTLRRRKLYLLIPMLLITGAVAFYTRRLPERFRARALVASEAVAPSPYLSGRSDLAAGVNVQEHLRTIRETILSPSALEKVIREFDLYIVDDREQLDRAIESMKGRILIQVEAADAFYVGFEGDQPKQVMQVANRLAALFVERTSAIRGQRVARVDSVLDG